VDIFCLMNNSLMASKENKAELENLIQQQAYYKKKSRPIS